MVQIKVAQAQFDTGKVWRYQLPEVGATEAQLAAVETFQGERLDSRLRQFLALAGGWRSFIQRVDLFGPGDLAGGPRYERAVELLSRLNDSQLADSGYERADLMPIACSSDDVDVFAIVRGHAHGAGSVLWFSAEEIDRYPGFDDYFLAMMEYNRRDAEHFRTGRWPPLLTE